MTTATWILAQMPEDLGQIIIFVLIALAGVGQGIAGWLNKRKQEKEAERDIAELSEEAKRHAAQQRRAKPPMPTARPMPPRPAQSSGQPIPVHRPPSAPPQRPTAKPLPTRPVAQGQPTQPVPQPHQRRAQRQAQAAPPTPTRPTTRTPSSPPRRPTGQPQQARPPQPPPRDRREKLGSSVRRRHLDSEAQREAEAMRQRKMRNKADEEAEALRSRRVGGRLPEEMVEPIRELTEPADMTASIRGILTSSTAGVRQAILLSEILGPPVSLRPQDQRVI